MEYILHAVKAPLKLLHNRRPHGSLSREQVVDAALRLADEQGLDALTIPALARRLECAQHQFLPHVGSVINVGATRRFAERSERRLTKYEFNEMNRRP
jgi:hypothetical protein